MMDVRGKNSRDHEADRPPPVEGAQSIHRAIALLKQVATQHAGGVRLQALCDEVGLGMPTAHRIMRSLMAEACPEFAPESAPSDWFIPNRASYGRPAIAAS